MKKRKQKNTKMKRIECTDAKIQYNVTINRGLVDELIITTHTMIGGERTSTASRFDVVPNKLALQVYLARAARARSISPAL